MSTAVVREVLRQLSITRREVLTLVEAVYGETAQWSYVRTQLLRALGEKGLEGAVQRIAGENRDSVEFLRKHQISAD